MQKVGKYLANTDQGSGAAVYKGVMIPLLLNTIKILLMGL